MFVFIKGFDVYFIQMQSRYLIKHIVVMFVFIKGFDVYFIQMQSRCSIKRIVVIFLQAADVIIV